MGKPTIRDSIDVDVFVSELKVGLGLPASSSENCLEQHRTRAGFRLAALLSRVTHTCARVLRASAAQARRALGGAE